MKNILYIGNHLKRPKANISAIGILGPLLSNEGYTVYMASSKNAAFWRMLDMLLKVIKYAKKVDVVLIDTYSTTNFYYALLVSQLCRTLNLPYIPILHGGNLPQRLAQAPKRSKLLFKHAYKLVAPSIYLKEAFAAYGYKQVCYIPNSLNMEHYVFQEKDFSSMKLLWVRSFSAIYNPTLAVRVLKSIQDSGHDCELCMVGPDTGDGSLQATKQLANDLNLTVKFTGKLTKPEWQALAADYNLFINTTNFDNMPVSVMEAMALGLPVVSTNVGGMPYLIQDKTDGHLVPPNNVDAFVAAIIQLLKKPEASRKLALKARKKVEQYDWEQVKQAWFEVLR